MTFLARAPRRYPQVDSEDVAMLEFTQRAFSMKTDPKIDLNHLDSSRAGTDEAAARQCGFDIVSLALKIEAQKWLASDRATFDLVSIGTVRVVADEGRAGGFDSGCQINFDEFRDYLRAVARSQVT